MLKKLTNTIKRPPVGLLLFLALIVALAGMRMEETYNAAGGATADFTSLTSTNANDIFTTTQGPILILAISNNADSAAEVADLRIALSKYANQVTFVLLDIDAEPNIASALQVTADQTPVLELVEVNPSGGLTPLNQSTGFLTAAQAQQFMDAGLSKIAPAKRTN